MVLPSIPLGSGLSAVPRGPLLRAAAAPAAAAPRPCPQQPAIARGTHPAAVRGALFATLSGSVAAARRAGPPARPAGAPKAPAASFQLAPCMLQSPRGAVCARMRAAMRARARRGGQAPLHAQVHVSACARTGGRRRPSPRARPLAQSPP
ncbi:MAG: hypothetical protein J3K34DRAFT_399447 [Monoraphidium minutum]|nr:MAG: hypothetical protein J3K34DRAFT_399447 [Monoraphidium minutum]